MLYKFGTQGLLYTFLLVAYVLDANQEVGDNYIINALYFKSCYDRVHPMPAWCPPNYMGGVPPHCLNSYFYKFSYILNKVFVFGQGSLV